MNQVELVQGALDDPGCLRRALDGVQAAFYLAHTMLSERRLQEAERVQAATFAEVARGNNLGHVVYLGGASPQPSEGFSPP